MLNQRLNKIPRVVYPVLGGLICALVLCRIAAIPLNDVDINFHGNFTVNIYLLMRVLATYSGAFTLGALIYVNTSTRRDEARTLFSYRSHTIAERSSTIWAVCALVQLIFSPAKLSGVPVGELLVKPGIGSVYAAVEEPIGWIIVLIVALVITVCLRLTLSWSWRVWLSVPAAIACIAIPVTGNSSQGHNHDWTTGLTIILILSVSISLGYRYSYSQTYMLALGGVQQDLQRRARLIKLYSGIINAIVGVGVYLLLVPIATIFHFWYGIYGLIAVMIWVLAMVSERNFISYLFMAVITTMSILPAPLSLVTHSGVWDNYLGYELFQGPSLWQLMVHWRYDVILGSGAIGLLIVYLYGVHMLHKRGDIWKWQRTVNWIIGCIAFLFFTSSGFNPYGAAQFSVHMVVHMALNMFVPVFLVLGAPVTLVLRVCRPRSKEQLPSLREWVLDVVHSTSSKVLTHPISAMLIFIISLYGLYYTPVFELLVKYHWGHLLMNTHFIITGYIFYWAIIGIDPGGYKTAYIGKLGVVFAIMPFHVFFGVATMMMERTIIAGRFYQQLAVPWVHSLAGDQSLAGAITWASSEIPVVFVIIVLLRQWYKKDARDAKRKDRYTQKYDDSEYETYNAMLKQLARYS